MDIAQEVHPNRSLGPTRHLPMGEPIYFPLSMKTKPFLSTLSGEIAMKTKINEDWLSVILAYALIVLALIGLIAPTWMKF